MAEKKKKTKKDWPGTAAFFILWNPDSELPPKVMFQTIKQAEIAGEQMARKTGEGFIIMKAVRKLELPPPPLKVTEYE